MALPMYLYRNPLDVLLNAESRTCKGCVHLTSLWTVKACGLNPKKSGDKLKRCKRYKDTV